jgi:hypothetical protein
MKREDLKVYGTALVIGVVFYLFAILAFVC